MDRDVSAGRPPLWQLAALASLLLTAACGGSSKNPACTEMGCQTGMRIGFRSASGQWSKGTYRVQVLADDASANCTVTIPLPKDAEKPACAGDFVVLEQDGALLPIAAQKLGGVQVLRAAEKITVRVSRDGRELVQGTYAPAWRSVQPNGPGCPPTCQQGDEAEMVIP